MHHRGVASRGVGCEGLGLGAPGRQHGDGVQTSQEVHIVGATGSVGYVLGVEVNLLILDVDVNLGNQPKGVIVFRVSAISG